MPAQQPKQEVKTSHCPYQADSHIHEYQSSLSSTLNELQIVYSVSLLHETAMELAPPLAAVVAAVAENVELAVHSVADVAELDNSSNNAQAGCSCNR